MDAILSQHFETLNVYRTKVELVTHMYLGSLLGYTHGSLQSNHPACFEYTNSSEESQPGFNYYNLECLPNDVHPSHTKECLPREKTSDVLNGNLGKRWKQQFEINPNLKEYFLDIDERLKEKTLSNDLTQ